MKKSSLTFVIIALILISGLRLSSQVASSCAAHDTIIKKYLRDADRLALREQLTSGSTYKDSIWIEQPTRSRMLAAIIAVYNATSIPVTDTVMRKLKVHTGPLPEVNRLEIHASGANSFMQKLSNSIVPTGDNHIDGLMSKYWLVPSSYYQSQTYDVAILRTDSNYNMQLLSGLFKTNQFVMNSTVNPVIDHTQEITATLNIAYVDLNFTHRWQTCEDGCDFSITWKFRVYTTCMVEYRGWTGDRLDTGLPQHSGQTGVSVFPNPFHNQIRLDVKAGAKPKSYSIINTLGQVVQSGEVSSNAELINTTALARGLYFFEVRDGAESVTFRMIKD